MFIILLAENQLILIFICHFARFEANYPERLKTAFLINAPKVFSILFALIKPLLTARTLSKVQIYASNAAKWKLALLNNIPADQVIDFFWKSYDQIKC